MQHRDKLGVSDSTDDEILGMTRFPCTAVNKLCAMLHNDLYNGIVQTTVATDKHVIGYDM